MEGPHTHNCCRAPDLKEFYCPTRLSNNLYFFITLYPCLSSMLKIWII